MKRRYITGSILAFWLAAMAWLVRYEAFPSFFTQRVSGYGDLFAQGPLVADNWMKILVDGVHVGYSHTLLDVRDNDPASRVQINNQTAINIQILGLPQSITIRSSASLDLLYNLQRFNFAVSSDAISMSLHARRLEDNLFKITALTPMGRQIQRIRLPDDVVLYSPMMEMAMKKLRPGQSLTIATLDPSTLTRADLNVRAVRREKVKVGGQDIECMLLTCTYSGLEVNTWMDEDGKVIRQETPLGWVLEASNPSEAAAYEGNAVQAGQLLKMLAQTPALSPSSPIKEETP